jgi:hypothetical protein
MPTISIPVKLHTPDAVVTESEGLIKFEEGRLVLEYQTKDAFFGTFRSEVKELEIPPDDVSSITFKRGLFKTELMIRAKTMKKFGDVPGAKLGQVKLRFRKRHRAEAEELADFLEHRLQQIAEAGDEEVTEFVE